MKLKHIVLLVLVLVLGGLLTACGGSKEEPTPTSVPPTETPAGPVGDPEAGKEVFMSVCVACHGPDAKGLPNLGKSLHASDSEFIRSKTDDELVEFIKQGRTPDDPLNTTGVGMPAKGGNPAITDQQLYDVVAYIRTLK
jgi:disulfide bond formation protein DsbB